MMRRMKSKWFLAGLCSLAATFVGVSDALAGSSAGNAITVMGKYKPGGGDPPFDLTFDVFLNAPDINTPGTNTFTLNDSFTVLGLPGVNSVSLHNEPFSPPSVEYTAGAVNTVVTPNGPAPYQSDFTWIFKGSGSYSATTPSGGPVGGSVFLGEFSLITTFDFPPGTAPFHGNDTVLTFNFTIDGGQEQGTGNFMMQGVPEPSSALLLALGFGIFPLILIGKRLRRRLRSVD